MVHWINRHKTKIQVIVVLLGLAMLLLNWQQGHAHANGGALSDKAWKRLLMSLSKPAEIGIFALVGLFAVRMSFKVKHGFKDLGRWLLRLLQVIHIPLASIVILAATIHGGLFVLTLWESNLHYWSGVVALICMLATGVLGLITIKGRKNKTVHLTTGLVTFALVLIHIVIPSP
jgi:hypothetical protein